MLPFRDHSFLVVIDVQERLAQAMPAKYAGGNLARVQKLIQGARTLGVPVLYTEQYPKGLGPTLPAVRELLADTPRFEKTCFSCLEHPPFMEAVQSLGRNQAVLVGIEAHVCVLQTAVQFQEKGFSPFVVRDAVLSRFSSDYQAALDYLHLLRIPTPTAEIVLFSWLGGADQPGFKEISRLVKERDE